MRKISVPPVCRAYAQLNSAVRIIPTCGVPVGEGQKRTRTSEPVAVEKGREVIARPAYGAATPRAPAARSTADASETTAAAAATRPTATAATSTGPLG